MRAAAPLAAAWFALAGSPVEAARPLITDDAGIVPAKACQLEAGVQRYREFTEAWATPACNFTGNLEIGIGEARNLAGGHTFIDNTVQAKTVVKELMPNGWGVAFAAGTTLRRGADRGWPGDPYLNVPVSLSFRDDAWLVHVNAGAVRRRDEQRNEATWGIGNEIRIRDDVVFLGEVFRREPGRPFYQLGLRYVVVKDRVQVDATFANRATAGSRESWTAIGVRLLSPPFLP